MVDEAVPKCRHLHQPTILNHLGIPVDLSTSAPAGHARRGPPEEAEAGAMYCPEDRWYVDEAMSIENYLTDGPGYEEPAFGIEA